MFQSYYSTSIRQKTQIYKWTSMEWKGPIPYHLNAVQSQPQAHVNAVHNQPKMFVNSIHLQPHMNVNDVHSQPQVHVNAVQSASSTRKCCSVSLKHT